MKLIIILICLALERYLQVGVKLSRFAWFNDAMNWIERKIQVGFLRENFIFPALLIVPSLLIFSLIYCSVSSWFFGLVGFLINIIVLLYCLGPDDLYHQANAYFSASDNDDSKKQARALTELMDDESISLGDETNRLVTERILIASNSRLFGVIFWFVVLGPFGPLLYRLMSSLWGWLQKNQDNFTSAFQATTILQQLLDWIPARLATLTFCLVGNFSHSFNCWLSHALSGLDSNQKLLRDCGLAALNVQAAEKADINENKAAVLLLDRALIVILVVIAMITIGSLID